tara:strand:- start:5658 stop:6122 length:465 start_codon:yes stop_codon:yes gene_type:complete
MLEMLFPKSADNNYLGYKSVLYIFIPFLMLMTWRSVIHMSFEEFGLHGIANVKVLTGNPDPMPLIYAFFSVWGLVQLIFCAFAWIVIIRYRSLMPLIILAFLVEWSVRVFTSSAIVNNPIYSDGITPGMVYAPYVTLFLLILFVFSLIKKIDPI